MPPRRIFVPTTDFETSIADFLALGQRLQAAQPLTGERVLEELTAWYRNSRVEGAAIDEDADMLLLQWGATCPLVVSEPTDLRKLGDDDLKFGDHELQYLDFTRQVFAAGEDEDAEFDDEPMARCGLPSELSRRRVVAAGPPVPLEPMMRC